MMDVQASRPSIKYKKKTPESAGAGKGKKAGAGIPRRL
jgi:hypothetical protein